MLAFWQSLLIQVLLRFSHDVETRFIGGRKWQLSPCSVGWAGPCFIRQQAPQFKRPAGLRSPRKSLEFAPGIPPHPARSGRYCLRSRGVPSPKLAPLEAAPVPRSRITDSSGSSVVSRPPTGSRAVAFRSSHSTGSLSPVPRPPRMQPPPPLASLDEYPTPEGLWEESECLTRLCLKFEFRGKIKKASGFSFLCVSYHCLLCPAHPLCNTEWGCLSRPPIAIELSCLYCCLLPEATRWNKQSVCPALSLSLECKKRSCSVSGLDCFLAKL